MLLALAIVGVVLYALIAVTTAGRRLESQVGGHLALQADARRAVVSFLRELQEAIVVIRPAPGQTASHALVRDKLNRLAFYSLSGTAKKGEYDLFCDLVGPKESVRTRVLSGVSRATFTSLSDGALLLHIVLGSGAKRLAFHTQVRLRNRPAAEEP